jgi:hypothetical protein
MTILYMDLQVIACVSFVLCTSLNDAPGVQYHGMY